MSVVGDIILTRQAAANEPWHRELAARGLPVRLLPLLRYESLPRPADVDPAAFDWILFTSPQGIRAFLAADLAPGSARLAALGYGTADLLAERIRAADLPAGATGADLARIFLEQVVEPVRVLLPGPTRRLAEPAASLRTAGHEVIELPLYETLPMAAEALPVEPCRPEDVVFFCSPSAVKAFAGVWTERPRCVAIGETTAAVCRDLGFPTAVARTPDLDAMIAAADLADWTSPLDLERES